MRPIDADALLEDIEREYNNHYPTDRDIMDCVRYADTIDPVRHGEWVYNEQKSSMYENAFDCSVCKEAVYVDSRNGYETPTQKYCPNCGAKMDAGCN